jgi:hypothetical protein
MSAVPMAMAGGSRMGKIHRTWTKVVDSDMSRLVEASVAIQRRSLPVDVAPTGKERGQRHIERIGPAADDPLRPRRERVILGLA